MKHIKKMTVAKAQEDLGFVGDIIDVITESIDALIGALEDCLKKATPVS